MTDDDIGHFFATLAAANPHPQTELEFTSVFELLAAVLLSAQATDVSVNKATRCLFAQAPTPQALLDLGLDRVTESIRTIDAYRPAAVSPAPPTPTPEEPTAPAPTEEPETP